MPLYKFIAKDKEGKNVTGEVEVLDEPALIKTLQEEGLIPIKISARDKQGLGGIKLPKIFGGVNTNEVVSFTREFSTMISAGLPITDALVILERQTKNPNFGRILSDVVSSVEGGMSLSASFAKHKDTFDVIYIKLIEAGETGGVLDKVLMKLADGMEKEKDFKGKTKGAFIYPAIVIVVMIAVMFAMMIFVIPKLTSLYKEIGTSLPLPTKILIAVSDFTRNFWYLIIFGSIGGAYGFKVFSKTPKGEVLVSRLVYRLPVWGKIRKQLTLSQFTRTLGLLIGTGIPIITALKVVAEILSSPTYKAGIDLAIDRVERGSPLYQPISANPAFPPIIGQMIRVGEETGKLDEILNRLSIYFESESENSIRNLTAAMEPVILVILGLGVGVLVLSVILPIYNLTSQF